MDCVDTFGESSMSKDFSDAAVKYKFAVSYDDVVSKMMDNCLK